MVPAVIWRKTTARTDRRRAKQFNAYVIVVCAARVTESGLAGVKGKVPGRDERIVISGILARDRPDLGVGADRDRVPVVQGAVRRRRIGCVRREVYVCRGTGIDNGYRVRVVGPADGRESRRGEAGRILRGKCPGIVAPIQRVAGLVRNRPLMVAVYPSGGEVAVSEIIGFQKL